MHRWLIPLVIFSLVACEARQPVNRGQAASIADNVQRQHGVAWGDPTEVLAPAAGPDGHRWWQVRYPEGQIVLVDADSGWGRLPPAGYHPRVRALPTRQAAVEEVVVEEGSLVLRLSGPEELSTERAGELEREAVRLNGLAAHTGLHPLFSVRSDRQGHGSLLYGWQGDRGIARDQRVAEWVRVRTDYHEPQWIDLLPE